MNTWVRLFLRSIPRDQPVFPLQQISTIKTERIPDSTDSEVSKPKPATCPPPLIHVPLDEDAPAPKKVCIEKSVDVGEGSGSELSAGGNDDGEGRKRNAQTTPVERRGREMLLLVNNSPTA